VKARIVIISLVLVALAAFVAPVAADCAGQEGTVGCLISGEVYGNTSNERPGGNGVVPSLCGSKSVSTTNFYTISMNYATPSIPQSQLA